MHVAIAGMAEDHDREITPRRRISQQLQVFSKTFHRHAAVLDHLQRPLRHRQPGEDRTRRVAQRPDRRLVLRRARPHRARARRQGARSLRRVTAASSASAVSSSYSSSSTASASGTATSAPVVPLRTTSRKVRSSSSHADGPVAVSAAITSAIRSSVAISTRSADRNGGIGSRRHVDLRHDAERPLGADEEVEQVARLEPGVERVARGVLPGVGEARADHRGRRPG